MKLTMPSSRSDIKSIFYDALEDHYYKMVWTDRYGSSASADLWWAETMDWLNKVSIEKINQVVSIPDSK